MFFEFFVMLMCNIRCKNKIFGMSKTGVTLLVFIFHSSIRLVNAIECESTYSAQVRLESYYTWWYRLKNIYTKTNPLCSLDDENRKRLCAEVAKACYKELNEVEIKNVLEVMDTPTQCEKHMFTTALLKNYEAFWSRKKRMFLCKQFTVTGIRPIADFYLSAAGQTNAVTVFNKPSVNSPIIRLVRLVTGLSYQEEKAVAKEPSKKEAKEPPKKEAKEPPKKEANEPPKKEAKEPQKKDAKDVPQKNKTSTRD